MRRFALSLAFAAGSALLGSGCCRDPFLCGGGCSDGWCGPTDGCDECVADGCGPNCDLWPTDRVYGSAPYSPWGHFTHAGCAQGCGETYWGEWLTDPPDCCDPCDECSGDYVGPRACGPRVVRLWDALWGGSCHAPCGDCGFGACGGCDACGGGYAGIEPLFDGADVEGYAHAVPHVAAPTGRPGCASCGEAAVGSGPLTPIPGVPYQSKSLRTPPTANKTQRAYAARPAPSAVRPASYRR